MTNRSVNISYARSLTDIGDLLAYIVEIHGKEIYLRNKELMQLLEDLVYDSNKDLTLYHQAIIDNSVTNRLYFYFVENQNDIRNINKLKRQYNTSDSLFNKTPQIILDNLINAIIDVSTEATESDGRVMDDYGVIYSSDGTKLIEFPEGLKRYHIKEGTQVLCDNSFQNGLRLEELFIPESVKYMESRIFHTCYSLYSIKVSSKNKKFTSIDGLLYSRDLSILIHFPKGKRQTSFEIQSFVTHIGDWAFFNCELLQKIQIPRSVIYIGEFSFLGCYSLNEIDLPHSVKEIGPNAMAYCENLKEIKIPESVTYLGSNAFYSCSNLQSINIPDSVTDIGNSCFSKCSSLGSIKIPNSITILESFLFSDCSNLVSVSIPDSVVEIGSYTFMDCISLRYINIPDSVISIEEQAFSGCSNLISISLPNSITEIKSGTFENCINLKTIQTPDSLKRIYFSVFDNCISLQSIKLPKSITDIGFYPFRSCDSLKIVLIHKSCRNKKNIISQIDPQTIIWYD